MKATLLLPVTIGASLFFGACAKQEPESAREAEINRRVQERLVAEHQAEEKQRLGQRETALAAREKTLAERENSFATMSAAPASAAEPATAMSDDGEAYSDSVANPGVTGVIYPEQYGYASPNEPDLIDDPYLFGPTYPVVAIVNTSPRFIFINRHAFRAGRGSSRPGFPSGGFRGTNMPPRTIGRAPMPVIGRRPVSSGGNRTSVSQSHAVARRSLTYTR